MLQYGNPGFKEIENIRTSILLEQWKDKLVPLTTVPYPNDDITQKEIMTLIQKGNSMSSNRYEECLLLDEMLYEMWSNYLDSYGVSISVSEIEQLIGQYEVIIDYIKMVYNRPRPFQVAGYYGLSLYPRVKSGSTDSSYPSGHTLLSLYIYHFMKDRYPHLSKDLMWMVLNVKESREELGVHYPSDNLFSFQVYQYLTQIGIFNRTTYPSL